MSLQPLPHGHPGFWLREAFVCQDDGYPGAAAYAVSVHRKAHPELSACLLPLQADLMATQLGYRPESIDG